MASSLQDIRLQIVIDVKNQPAIKTLQRSLDTVKSSTDNVSKAFTNQKSVMHPLAESWRQMTSNLTMTEKAMDAVWRASSHLEEMGRRLLDVSRQIIDLGVGIVETYADYDYWLRRAAVALNTNAVWQQKLDQAIQDTAIAIGLYDPAQVAEAYNTWGAATGVVVDNQKTLAEVTTAVQAVMIATAGAGGSLETNLKGVSGILGLFNMNADQAAHVVEILALMTERTQADFGDLISSFTFLGPQAEAMGISFEQVAQMLGIVADNGQRGSRAGRGLSMVIEGLTTPTEEVKNALSAMTLATEGVAKSWDEIIFPQGQFAGMESIVYDLARTYYSASDAERAYFISKGLSNNAIRAFLPLIQDTVDMWERDSTAMAQHKTALDKQKYSLEAAGSFFEGMTTQMLGSIKAVIGSFKNSFFPILQMVAMKIMELAQPILDRLKVALDRVTSYLKENPGVVDFIVKIGVAIGLVAGLAGTLFALVGTVLGLVTAFVMFVSTVLPLVGIFGLLFGIVARFVKAIVDNTNGIRDAFIKLGSAITGMVTEVIGPIGELKAALEPILTAISSGFDTFIGILSEAISQLADALNKLTPDQINTIRDILKVLGFLIGIRVALGLTAGTIGILTGAISGLAGVVGGSIGAIMGILRLLGITRVAGAIYGLVMAITGADGLLAALAALATNPYVLAIIAIVGAIVAAFAAYQTNFGGFKDAVDPIIQWLVNDVIPKIAGFVEGVLGGIGEFIKTIGAWIDQSVKPALEDFIAWIGETFGPLIDQMGETIAAIISFFDQLLKGINTDTSTITAILGIFIDWFGNFFANTFNNIVSTIKGVLEGAVTFIKGILEVIQGVFEVFEGLLTGDWDQVWDGIFNILKGVWDIITGFIGGVVSVVIGIFKQGLNIVFSIFETIFGLAPGSIMNTITGFIDKVIKFAGDVIDGFVDGFTSMFTVVTTAVSGFFTNVLGFITGTFNIVGKIFQIGKDIVTGLWNGIVSLKNWIITAIMNFIKSILPDPIEQILGIQSPSKVMAGYGKNVIAGLALGIRNSQDAYVAMVATTEKLSALAASGTENIGFSGAFSASLAGGSVDRVIRLEVDVTSSDGAVDGVDLAKLADLITGSEMVRAIEHMATVD